MRACAKDRCGTELSDYNRGPLCHAHAEQVLAPLIAWLRPQAWHGQARCQRWGLRANSPFDSEVYSRDRGNPLASRAVRLAKTACVSCPVRANCLADALTMERAASRATRGNRSYVALPGIWGGTLPVERREAAKTRRSMETLLHALLEDMTEQARAEGLAKEDAA